MKNISLYTLFKYLAIAGNVLFILWVTYNGIDEGFSGTRGSESVVCQLDAVAVAQYGFDFEKRKWIMIFRVGNPRNDIPRRVPSKYIWGRRDPSRASGANN